tara:strand:+ start:3082 stop:4248 length:1167 start_codon:yes stop_codon:yes gene_type:complete
MRIYLQENVFEAALERTRYLFDEFENVMVCVSGGKDSTVVYNLCKIVAREKNKLPLKVLFLDQEAEWQSVVDYVREIMTDPDVEPYWVQCPIVLKNATSIGEPFLKCWEEGADWMRPKESFSIKENKFGTERFHPIWANILRHYFPKQKACYIVGMRAEESPARLTGLGSGVTYKHITWGAKKHTDQYNFYPIYDWSIQDVWKAIHDNNWSYCQIYDEFYRKGIPLKQMRVSNLHHETATHALFYLQELEGDTWDKLVMRLKGINQTRHLSKSDMFQIKVLPPMFNDWIEYRDYLIEHLTAYDEHKEIFRKRFAKMDKDFDDMLHKEDLYKRQCNTVLANDIDFTKLETWTSNPFIIRYIEYKRGKKKHLRQPRSYGKYIPDEAYNVS